jgi:3-mercaptopyruvate sulfurtransferase SseA
MKTFVVGKKKVVIVDARTPAEYGEGHIPGAINISYEKFPKIGQYLPKNKTVSVISIAEAIPEALAKRPQARPATQDTGTY